MSKKSNKMERKFTRSHTYQGLVGGLALTAEGRTKREAEKRLRTLFANAGRPTVNRNPEDMELAYTDLLSMEKLPETG